MLKTLISWKYQTFINRFKHGKSARMVILTVVIVLLWLMAMIFTVGAGRMLSTIQNADAFRIWKGIFGFTSFFALFLPLRQMRSGKTGMGKFNFLPITKLQAYLKDWFDRLMMMQTLLFFVVLLVFGLVFFPVEKWIIFIPIMLGWIVMLQVLTRLVFALFQWLKSRNWFSQQLVTVFVVMIYIAATNMKEYPVLQEYFSVFADYWISSLFASALAIMDTNSIFIVALSLVIAIGIDRLLYRYLEEKDDEPQNNSAPTLTIFNSLKSLTGNFKNSWTTILSRHPMFGATFLIFPLIVTFTTFSKLSKPLVNPEDIERFTVSPMMFLSIILASYGLGIIGYFANAHLSDKTKIKNLMNGYKQIMVGFVIIVSMSEVLIPLIYFYENPISHVLIYYFFASLGLAFITIDLMFMVNAYFIMNIPSKMTFNTGNQPDRVAMTIVGMVIMVGSVLLKVGLTKIMVSMEGGVFIATGISAVLCLISFLVMPNIYSHLIYSRRETIVEKIKEM